ncbi:MAG: hypothetical protein KDC34_09370 [Saprospiraceae bacterium]|nr:hypothetical protein [Saprospiraceae bacterium]
MDKFYNQFKGNLESRPEPEFDPGAWEDMVRKLDARSKSKRRIFPWWWVGIPAFLALVFGNYLLFTQLSETNQRLESMGIQRDTVFQSRTIYQYDTIYKIQKIYLNTESNELAQAGTSNTSGQTLPPFLGYNSFSTFKPYNPFSASTQSPFLRLVEAAPLSVSRTRNDDLLTDIPGLAFYPEYNHVPDWFDFLPHIQAESQASKITILDRFRPDGMFLGVSGGLLALTGEHLTNRFGVTFGADAEITFGSHWSLWLEYMRQEIKLKGQSESEHHDFGFTYPDAPDDYVLRSVEAYVSSNNYGVGLKYRFNNRRANWRPFLSGGIIMNQVPPFLVEFKYINPISNDELEIKQNPLLPTGLLPNVTMQGGIQYRPKEHLTFEASMGCTFSTAPAEERLLPAYLGARIGVKYHLK